MLAKIKMQDKQLKQHEAELLKQEFKKMREDQEDSLSSVPSHYFNAFASDVEPEERKNFEKNLNFEEEIVDTYAHELEKN